MRVQKLTFETVQKTLMRDDGTTVDGAIINETGEMNIVQRSGEKQVTVTKVVPRLESSTSND